MATAPDPKDADGRRVARRYFARHVPGQQHDRHGHPRRVRHGLGRRRLPAGTPGGAQTLLVTGATTGTVARVPITVTAGTRPRRPPPRRRAAHDGQRQRSVVRLRQDRHPQHPAEPADRGRLGRGDVRVRRQARHGDDHGRQGRPDPRGQVAQAGCEQGDPEVPGNASRAVHRRHLGAGSEGRADRQGQGRQDRDKGDTTKVAVKVNAPDDIKVRGKIKLVIKARASRSRPRSSTARPCSSCRCSPWRELHAEGQVPRQRC